MHCSGSSHAACRHWELRNSANELRLKAPVVCSRRREFNLANDMFAQDSIELLKQSGIDFAQNESRGINVHEFGELLMSSGIVLNDEVSCVRDLSALRCAGAASASLDPPVRVS